MEKNKIILIIFSIAFAFQSIYAQDSIPEKRRWKRFQVEIFGGLAFMNPTDLNLRPEYDEQYLIHQREFYNYYFPSVQQGTPSDEFRKVKSSLPLGFRFRYRLSRFFSLSLGLKYFSKNKTSQVSAQFRASGDRPYILDYEHSPYSISTSGFSPFLGVHLSFGKMDPISFEVFLSGGPLFAECRYQIGINRQYSRNNSVYSANETSYEIQGNSIGISLNSGARINVGIVDNIKVFFEGGYSYQMAENLHGRGSYIYYIYRDPNTKEVSDDLSWEGYWGVKEIPPYAPLPSNEWEKDDPRVRGFKLDLSGIFLQLGISFTFSFQ